MKKVKVLFYHSIDVFASSFETTVHNTGKSAVYIALAALYLKTHLDLNKPEIAKNVEWLLPIQLEKTNQELIEIINREKPDLFCTSHYVWNHVDLMAQLEAIHDKIPSTTKIAVGGPHIDVHHNPDFYKQYPFVDYAVYAAGEEAFASLIESLVTEKKLQAINTNNISWYNAEKNKAVVADWKYIPQLKTSPFLANEELFTRMVQDLQDSNFEISLAYELTRGCPYSCTFCDWNGGFSNKVSRRRGTYRDEIDLFQKLEVKNILLSDANVAQYEEDLDLARYVLEKNVNEGAGFVLDGNYSKVRKHKVLEMFHIIGKINMAAIGSKYDYPSSGFMLSVQDINPRILENVDRPDVGWDEHVYMINDLHSAFPNIQIKIQLIQCLPGQTVESWRTTLREVCRQPAIPQIFINELLPASPAARDPAYVEKFKPVYSNSRHLSPDHSFYRGNFLAECVSFNRDDVVTMTILSHIYSALAYYRHVNPGINVDIEKIVDYYLTTEYYSVLHDNLRTNWLEHDNYYFTLYFDLTPGEYSASEYTALASNWAKNVAFEDMVFKHLSREDQRKIWLNKIKKIKKSQLEHSLG
jgi:tRNA A37 methylthiotransferase MiaB